MEMNRPPHPTTTILQASTPQTPNFRHQHPRPQHPRQFHPRPRTNNPHHRPRHHQNFNRGPRPFKFHHNQQEDIKQIGKIVLHSLPLDTTDSEIRDLLQGWVPSTSVIDVSFIHPKKKKDINSEITLIAFVQLDGPLSADLIVEFYQDHKNKLGTNGYLFTNKANVSNELNVTYCYQRQKPGKPLFISPDPYNQPITLQDPYNQPITLQDPYNQPITLQASINQPVENKNDEIEIKLERNSLLSTIQSIEEQLKLRLPDLFVSELEMISLRKEEKELSHSIGVKEEQLEIVKSELQELQEVKETYDKLSEEGV